MTDAWATNAELEALRNAAGIPDLPTQLTFEARMAISGSGPRAYDWSDKPHRIVYDLCREIEKNAAERDRLREALERIAGVKGPYSHPFPESNEGYGSFAIVTAREALKGEKA